MPDYSILDLVPVSQGISDTHALSRTGDLARLGDTLGYKRLWYAEHHGIPSIASSSPEVLIAHGVAHTKHIRFGSGGVMLPNHVPLRIVETYRTLAALSGDRVDLGIGRAGGTDQLTLQALHSFGGEHFPDQVAEVLAYENDDFPTGHPYSNVRVVPNDVALPPIWVLGSSGASAQFAGKYGFGYGFAAHFSQTSATPAFDAYRAAFKASKRFGSPHTILCIAVVCAPSDDEALWLANSLKLTWRNLFANERDRIQSPQTAVDFPYTPAEEAALSRQMQLVMTGSPETVRDKILAAANETGADEIMIACNLYDHEERLRSYRLLADALGIVAKE